MGRVRSATTLLLVAALVSVAVALFAPLPVAAAGQLGRPRATPVGTFGGISYVQYDGLFEGRTSTGAFRVPYRITAPADPARGNGTVLVEPSHFTIALGTLERRLGRDFLFSRGFAHAGIGWSTHRLRILDPSAPGTFIEGGFHERGDTTDDEILSDFARALASDPEAAAMLGRVARRHVTGFSDSSYPVLRLITSGRAAGVFDFALPYTVEDFDPQAALAAGRYGGKLIIVNSEAENPKGLVDHGQVPHQYRFYAVAGAAHLADDLGVPFISSGSTPASYTPALRAHFLQGHDWVQRGTPPPPSTHLSTARGNTIDRDASGNAIAVDESGRRVPRLPFIELGEARYISGFVGSYEAVKTIGELGFATHGQYRKAFADKLADYARAGYILPEDADAMRHRAGLCTPKTFTETYRDHYEKFVAITPCGG
jgi:hypothetical protein